jgi:hypothetical protein
LLGEFKILELKVSPDRIHPLVSTLATISTMASQKCSRGWLSFQLLTHQFSVQVMRRFSVPAHLALSSPPSHRFSGGIREIKNSETFLISAFYPIILFFAKKSSV